MVEVVHVEAQVENDAVLLDDPEDNGALEQSGTASALVVDDHSFLAKDVVVPDASDAEDAEEA